uniref:Uncharacterized protein n=1 Tax=Anguilla anguilla TaxID=7936 RepID=A0A0E9Q8Y7_ANGAN
MNHCFLEPPLASRKVMN